jgi:Xaa-Pro aminopeptidase
MLTKEGCGERLAGFREELAQQGIDLALVSNYRNVYYLSGHLREVELPQCLVIGPSGKTALITDAPPAESTADEVARYEAYSLAWPISFRGISEKASEALKSVLAGVPAARKIGVEKDHLRVLFGEVISGHSPHAELVDVGPLLYRSRKRKHPDEVQLIADCAKAIEAGYAVARLAIHPGATELDVFKETHGEIVRHAGYNLKFDGDFACGVRAINGGGTPLQREILPGDLYIIDIYPSFHGYHADLCRTFAASAPTDLQKKAWDIAREALKMAEEIIRPGVPACDVWKQLRDYIDSFELVRGSFNHHAGHGIGLDPQEPPWIIPGSDHVFEVGDVIAVEPGCYAEALQGGVRLECDYVVRENGLENLSSFRLEF